MSSDVTVVIPFKKGSRKDWLAEAIASIPEGTPHRVYENENDLPGAMNQGLREAETEFVYFLGADDKLDEHALEYLVQFSTRADVVYPSLVICDADLNPSETLSADPFCAHRLERMNFITGASLVRRAPALAAGGFRECALEDWDLWLRMHKRGARFVPCAKAELLYRQHGESRNARAREDPEWLDKVQKEISPSLTELEATFYPSATPATSYLRCQIPSRHLPGMTMPAMEIAWNGDTEIQLPAQVGDAAILQLSGDQLSAAYLACLRKEGVRVLVEVDDNYLQQPGKFILQTSNWTMKRSDKDYVGFSRSNHRWITEHADGAIVTNRRLAEAYSKVAKEVFICPNVVDPADWPEPKKPDDGILRIVWVASRSHIYDISVLTRAFEWASRQPDVEVYTAGIKPGWKFAHGHLPWLEDLALYREIFSYFDIGVAPIKQLPFAQYRSDIKATEYAMGLCAPVLQDCDSYEDWTDGENCLKAADSKGFLRAIQRLVADRDEVRDLAAAAREFALRERSIEAQLGCWKEAIAA